MAKYIYHSEKSKTTCKECSQHDGKVYYNIKDLPKLPIHPNCKSWIETVEDRSDRYQCDCKDRMEVLKTNLYNVLENADNMQKSTESELLECAIALGNPAYESYSKGLQGVQEKLLLLKTKLSPLIKSTKDLSVDIDMSKEFSFDPTYHVKSECKMTNSLNKHADSTTNLCKKLNDLSEELKQLKERRKVLSKEAEKRAKDELKELKKGAMTGQAVGAYTVPLPGEDSNIGLIAKNNVQNDVKNKTKLLDKIPLEEKTKEEETSSEILRIKSGIEYNEYKNPSSARNTSGANNVGYGNKNSRIQDAGFNSVIGLIHVTEGGFVDNPNDRGGRTNRGITQTTYNAYNKKHGIPLKDVKYITKEEADTIYYKEYWLASGADKIKDPNLAYMHFDAAVNHGVYQANKFLKQSGGDFDKYYDLRKKFYTNLAKKPNQQGFYKGWINRIDGIDKIRKENVLKAY